MENAIAKSTPPAPLAVQSCGTLAVLAFSRLRLSVLFFRNNSVENLTGPHPCVLPKDLILSCHAQAPTWGTILARRLSIPENVINPLHDPLCPLNAGCYEPIRAWAALRGSKQIICRPHVHRRQDRCHNSNHPLSAFVHAGQDTTFALYSPEESW